MTHTPHELAEEFPDKADKIHEMKTNNAHFVKLANEYHELNRTIHRLETRVEAASEEREEGLRRKRMRLKDEIFAILEKS